MANHESSKKRARQTIVRNERNRQNMSQLRTAVRKVKDAVAKNDVAALEALLREAQSTIARTRRKGTIHRNNAARRISRLAQFVNKAKAAAAAK